MSEARERVLQTAEKLFHERGYNSVSMRDIAQALGMRQASLYYHVPNGKEQLFVEVTERGLARHRLGLTEAIATAERRVEAGLRSAVRWVFSQPPLYLFKMMENDMPELSESNQRHLMRLSHESLFAPLMGIFASGQVRGEIRTGVDVARLTGLFLSILEGVAFAFRTSQTDLSAVDMADEAIDILLYGLVATPCASGVAVLAHSSSLS